MTNPAEHSLERVGPFKQTPEVSDLSLGDESNQERASRCSANVQSPWVSGRDSRL